jgi:hypothetical protein
MIIELTILADDGTPFIMDGCRASLIIEDKDGGDQLRFDSKIVGNKVINYYEMPSDKKLKGDKG